MEITFKTVIVAGLFSFLCGCTAQYQEVYVADFHSDDMESCKPSDVDLSHADALHFFEKAKPVDYKVIHDHYNVAPCYIEGTMQYHGQPCDWKIRAGSTGQIQCGQETTYFVCDNCDDLFR